MKKLNSFRLVMFCVMLTSFTIGCNNAADKDAAAKPADAAPVVVDDKPDMTKIKAEIQALETSWANADNARDTNQVAGFYSDDAVSMSNNKPMLVGKAAIRDDIAASLIKRPKGATVAYDVMDVFGNENTVTETGKITVKDATGKVTSTGKYMAVWEKRDGKYTCVRDISNNDAKEK